jgi:hypothetical protein
VLSTIPYLGAFLLGLLLGVMVMLQGVGRTDSLPRGLSPINLPTIGSFCSVFGAIGYLCARYTTLPWKGTFLIALLGGLGAGAAAHGVVYGWAVPSAASDVEDERYVLQGFFARVTSAITPASPGQIRYEHDGASKTVAARSLSDDAIEIGTDVVIERIENGIAFVEPWTRSARQLELPS